MNSLKELIALAKAKPGTLNFASAGNGSSTQLAPELFSTMAGIKMNHIPYKGKRACAGRRHGRQRAGRFRLHDLGHAFRARRQAQGLATTGAVRSPAAPDLPTVAEAGVPGFEVIGWNGVMAPAGTPPEVIAKLNAEIKKALSLPEVKDRIAGLGSERALEYARRFRHLPAGGNCEVGQGGQGSGARID